MDQNGIQIAGSKKGGGKKKRVQPMADPGMLREVVEEVQEDDEAIPIAVRPNDKKAKKKEDDQKAASAFLSENLGERIPTRAVQRNKPEPKPKVDDLADFKFYDVIGEESKQAAQPKPDDSASIQRGAGKKNRRNK